LWPRAFVAAKANKQASRSVVECRMALNFPTQMSAFKGSAWAVPTTVKVCHADGISGQNGPQIPNDRSRAIKRYNRFFRYD
jgi:hypothetical protein